jgi:hypothetical protein
MPHNQPISHPGAEVVTIGIPRWLCDRLIPGSLGLSRIASRSLPFDQQATFCAGWLGQALAQQVDRVEAEQTEGTISEQDMAAALLYALELLAADTDPRPTICRLEETVLAEHETPEKRRLARAASEILAAAWIDPGPGLSPTPIHQLPSAS